MKQRKILKRNVDGLNDEGDVCAGVHGSTRFGKECKKSKLDRVYEDTDYVEEEDLGSDGDRTSKRKKPGKEKKEMTVTTRQRALQTGKDVSSGFSSLIEFSYGLPPAPPKTASQLMILFCFHMDFNYPPPREKYESSYCTNPYKYRDSMSKLPLCSPNVTRQFMRRCNLLLLVKIKIHLHATAEYMQSLVTAITGSNDRTTGAFVATSNSLVCREDASKEKVGPLIIYIMRRSLGFYRVKS
ncbi:hypothetical protein SADUNF_Sadunf10G0045300 [Salix dunnii]|uniref:Uncharacterized protein n=1 Tax=Salix dunnii TaxID=1413687 RepID=A0A835MP10_9ROSI|nr:hypothetical protein SADUNF_Sadunf10G0045300 [Salix dunnii]